MKKLIILFFLICLFCAVPVSAEEIIVGTSADYRPFVYYDYNDTLAGLDVDLLTEIGKREGFTIRLMDMAFDGLIDSVTVGQIDLIGGAFVLTEERAARVLYSNTYYSNAAVMIAAKNGNAPDSINLENIRGLRIGVQRGSSFDQWLKTNLVQDGIISTQDIFTFSTSEGALKALNSGSVDIVMLDDDHYEHTYKASGNFKVVSDIIANEEYGYAAAPGSEALIARINDGLAKMSADGSLDALIKKYTENAGEEAEVMIARPSQIQIQPVQQPTATPIPPIDQPANCKNVMVFMSDVTYQDGSKVNPGQEFTKTWQIYNNGSCKWYEGYQIVYVDGDYMSGDSAVIPQLTIPGRTVDVPIKLKAPQIPGVYTAYYQLRAPDGTFFGPKLTSKIIVTEEQVSAPPVGASPVITQWQPNYYKGDNGFCPTVYWTVRNANAIHFSINNKRIYTTYYPSGSIVLCPRGGKGDYTYGIVAEGTKTVSYVFSYTNTGGPKPQPNIIPTPIPFR